MTRLGSIRAPVVGKLFLDMARRIGKYFPPSTRREARQMKIAVILENAPDCELSREIVDVDDSSDDFDSAVDDAVSHVIEGFVLSVGDTIKIVEVEA